MSENNLHQTRVGILGAGQLGLMMAQEASLLGIELHFLDASTSFPAGLVSSNITEGDFKNYQDVIDFGQDKDVLSIEIENVNTEALAKLEQQGVKVFPQAHIIALIKDKGLQKQFYQKHNIPSSKFSLLESKDDIIRQIETGSIHYPFVQKSRLAGYDGKGVAVIKNEKDISKIMDVPSVIEDLVDIKKELAIIIGRNESGQTSFFDNTEMVFKEEGNLLDYLISPADIENEIKEQCEALALQIIETLKMVGILAIEFFLTQDNRILINEVAPRPHNSGHHTIEANDMSQFKILLHILLNLPLKSIKSKGLSAIINVLGEKGMTGPPIYKGINKLLEMDETFIHLYGKQITKPLRKMGHVTVLGQDKKELIEKIKYIQTHLKVIT